MAILKFQNNTGQPLIVPYVPRGIKPYLWVNVPVVDIDQVYNDPRIERLTSKDPPDLTITLMQDSTPGSEGDAVLEFYATGDLPNASQNPGLMVYNTTNEQVQLSDGTAWYGVSTLLIISGSLPAPASVPAGYAVFSKDDQAIYINGGSAWMLTQANGITSRPSHQFPVANSVPVGTLLFDSDNQQMKLSDGTRWQLTNNVVDYNTIANIPAVTEIGFGGIVLTSRDGTLWARVGSNWIPCTGLVRFYATYGDLPTNATWGNDERGAIAYIDDARTFVVWGGKYWRHLMTPESFTTATLPAASGYITGHIIYNSDYEQHLHSAGGNWEGIQGSARPYAAGLRPANVSVPEGTIIWNTTSNKANWNIGGQWLDALGVVDP